MLLGGAQPVVPPNFYVFEYYSLGSPGQVKQMKSITIKLNNKILLFPTSVLNILVVSRVVYVVTQVVRFTVQSLLVKTVDHIPDQY